MPNGPSSMRPIGSQPERANAGSSSVYDHTENPASRAQNAPLRVPPFQKIPPSTTGANCATAANEIRPIDTSAYASPASRKYR